MAALDDIDWSDDRGGHDPEPSVTTWITVSIFLAALAVAFLAYPLAQRVLDAFSTTS